MTYRDERTVTRECLEKADGCGLIRETYKVGADFLCT